MTAALSDWIRKRGVLYALTQTPILALLVGFFLKLAPYPLMILSVLLAFVALPVWVAQRKNVSDDPEEPVHLLPRYALWALLPVPIFSLVRIPTHFLYGMAYWHPWYDFASALTGLPVNQYSTLLPGAFLYSLQGYSLTLGFFILFRRHSLLNAVLYICLFDTSIYSFIFPTFARVGMPSPPRWHAVAWIAHLLMAASVWFSPTFWNTVFPKRRALALSLAILILVAPYAFPIVRAGQWQFPTQAKIDRALFARTDLIRLRTGPVLQPGMRENRYELVFEFGPRTFKNYVGRLRALDARDLRIDARLFVRGEAVAWCRESIPELPSPNRFVDDEKNYFEMLHRMDRVSLPVTCLGPKRAPGEKLDVEWRASVRLIGDREEEVRSFGTQQPLLAVAEGDRK